MGIPSTSTNNVTFPPNYPSRAVRRAVRFNRESRLPAEWKAFLARRPEYRQLIRSFP